MVRGVKVGCTRDRLSLTVDVSNVMNLPDWLESDLTPFIERGRDFQSVSFFPLIQEYSVK
jgi:hypothetical protein